MPQNPEIIELEEMKFVGISLDHNVHESASGADPIPRLWAEFEPRASEITGGLNRYMGVSGPVLKGGISNYVAALQVSKTEKVPADMVAGTIPAGRYARFVHEGPMEKIWETVDFIHNKWVPSAGYKDHDCSQLEIYKWGIAVDSPDLKLEILVPLPG